MRNRPPGAPRRLHRDRLRSRRPRLERLEERQLLTTFLVTNTNDDADPGSLRRAILDANANPNVGGPDVIAFKIPGGGVQSIAPATPLPTLDEAVLLDGYSQPGASPNTSAAASDATLLIQLLGSSLPADQSFGLGMNAPGATIRGLAISGFQQAGIYDTDAAGSGLIAGNYIGLAATGYAQHAGGNLDGILLRTGSNTIGGPSPSARNVISGNAQAGIFLDAGASGSAGRNVIAGNYIGLGASGDAAVGNGSSGIVIHRSPGNTIGGPTASWRNVISGNLGAGVAIGGASATGNRIEANFLGTNRSGTSAVGNAVAGIALSGPGTTIGGMSVGARNVVSGNGGPGLYIGSGADGTVVQGSFFGLASTGLSAVPNADSGIVVDAPDAVIGGDVDLAGNVISGNAKAGIAIEAGGSGAYVASNIVGLGQSGFSRLGNGTSGLTLSGATGVSIGGASISVANVFSANAADGIRVTGSGSLSAVIQNNFLGTAVDGLTPAGNSGWGISIEGPSGVTVGGPSDRGNVIAYNGSTIGGPTGGVGILSGTGNIVASNAIYANVGPGIDLGEDGPTPNHAGSASEPNTGLNFPVLASALSSPTTTTVAGSLSAGPNSTYTVQFFASDVVDPSGFGEGQEYLGSAIVTTGPDGSGSFRLPLPLRVDLGRVLTALTIDAQGNTSEFSAGAVVADAATDLAVTVSGPPKPVLVGQELTYTITVTNRGPNPAYGVTLTDTLPANATYVRSGTPSPGSVTVTNGVLTADLVVLASGASATITLVVVPTAPGSLQDTAVASAPDGDTDPSNNSGTATGTVWPSADLEVTHSTLPASVLLGQAVSYTLTIRNNGPSAASGVILTDILPVDLADLAATSADATVSTSGNTVSASVPHLAVGATATVTIVVTPTTTGAFADSATVSANETDTIPANNSDAGTVRVDPSADLAVTLAGDPSSGLLGQPFTYRASAKNLGPSDATNVVLVDTLPDGVSFASGSAPGGTFVVSGQTITATFPILKAGDSAVLTIAVTPNVTGSILDTATVQADQGDPSGSNNAASLSTTIAPAADLKVILPSMTALVPVGAEFRYVVTVANGGPSAAMGTDAVLTLPAGLSAISVVPSQGSFESSGSTLTLHLGEIGSGDSATATLLLTASASGPLAVAASVSSDVADPSPSDNRAQGTIQIAASADLGVQVTAPSAPVLIDSDLTYTITVSNSGPSDATSATVRDTLPAGVTVVSADLPYTQSGQTLTIPLGTLASGGSTSFALKVHVATDAAASITNVATVSASESDPVSSNNSDSATCQVVPSADLSVVVSDGDGPKLVGKDLVYTIVVTNTGPSPADGVTLTDTFLASARYVGASLPDGASVNVSGDGKSVQIALGSLAVGASKTVRLTVRPTDSGTLTNLAQVSAAQADPAAGNSQSETKTTVAPSADLAVSLLPLPDAVVLGQSFTFTAMVTNHGPSASSGVVLTMTLPAGVQIGPFTPTAGHAEQSGQVVKLTLDSLASGTTASLYVVATPSAAGTLKVDASAAALVADGAPRNNSASTSVSVLGVADLAVIQTVSADPAPLHGPLVYTVDVTNAGPSVATNVVLADSLPAVSTFVSASLPDGTPLIPSGGVLTIPLGSLAVGGRATVRISVAPGTMGIISNSASASADQPDPNAFNNSNVRLASSVGIPGAIRFSSGSYTVDEKAGRAAITLVRTGGADGAVSVTVSTSGGSAVVGANYTSTTQTVTFGDGETTKTIFVPVLDDGAVGGDTTVGLVLSGVTGGAGLGQPSSAILTMTESDTPVPAPGGVIAGSTGVSGMAAIAPKKGASQVIVRFGGPIDAQSASIASNYVVLAGKKAVPVVSAAYDAASRSVTLTLRRKFQTGKPYRLVVNGTKAGAIRTPGGQLLDGDGNGSPGGDYTAVFRGPKPSVAKRAKISAHWARHLTGRSGR